MNPYTANELKDILESLIKKRQTTTEQAAEQLSQESPDLSDRDLVNTIIDAIPELLAKNNERWMQIIDALA